MSLAFQPSIALRAGPRGWTSNRSSLITQAPHRPAFGRSRRLTHSICMVAEEKRDIIRVAIPSKGGILDGTKHLLSSIGVDVEIQNPRQYVATLKGKDVQVWLQRPGDIVRKVRDGDVDLGFVGKDLVAEYQGENGNIVPVHERLGYGECRLAVAVPMSWEECHDMSHFRVRSQFRELRIATKYHHLTERFLKSHSIDNYSIVPMDGALEASTQMGTADCIIDLVSSGVTLRENMLKELSGGTIIDSSMQLIANRKHISEETDFGDRLRMLTRELLERIDAHLLGRENYNIIANLRGSSMVDVSRRLATQSNLRGVDGPTISPVVPPADSKDGMYAISIVLPKKRLYSAIQQLRSVGGSGVTVLPVSFVFTQECRRWNNLLTEIGMSTASDLHEVLPHQS